MALGTWDPKIDADSSELSLTPSLLNRLIGYACDIEEREDALTRLEQLLNIYNKNSILSTNFLDEALVIHQIVDYECNERTDHPKTDCSPGGNLARFF